MDDVDQWFENSNELSIESVLNTSIMVSPELSIYEKFKPYNLGARFIIVSDPNFLEAANRLRIHKNSRGIRTIVASTEVIGDTVNDIKTYLENAYNNWLVRPKWVLLLGDAEFIPTHYGTINSYDNIENAGDMFYGQFSDDATEIPVFGIGRIPVDTEEQAMDVVEKIINFETNPPTSFLLAGNPFYHTLTLAAQFQDCDNGHPVPDGQAVRKFAETTENIRDYIVGTGKMKANRIYAADNQNISPKYWSNGIEIPGYLQKPTFAWDGDRQDIIDAVNEGTSLLYHRDHGWWDSWGTPGFSFNDIADIHVNDNKYPVVYSINCASGIFDNETCDPFYNLQGWWYIHPNAVYWSEEFLRKPDGALAIIGDTRASSSNLNNDIAKGLFDATWPGYLTYGSDTVIRKLGDILNHAKGYLKSRGHDQSSLKQELLIYNLLGDPTIELKSKKAWKISIEKILFLEKGIEVNIRIPEAEPSLGVGPIFAIAKVKDRKLGERVIGRAILIHSDNSEDSIINIKLQENVNPEDITLTLSGNEIYTVQRAISK